MTVEIFDYRTVTQEEEFEQIPILDVAPYLADVDGAADELAANIRFVQETIGFYVIVNHGLDQRVINAAYAALERFFELPDDDKQRLQFGEQSVGYIAPQHTVYVTSTLNDNTKRDLNETLALAYDRPANHPYLLRGLRFVGPNPWPQNLPGFRAAIVNFQHAILDVAMSLVPLYALALEQPIDAFDSYFEDPIMWVRNSHYPAVEPEPNQFGIAPHSDHSFMTLLPMSEVSGLQVRTRTGRWIAADPVTNGIIVNTGEFLNRWSNGRFIATPHRVIPPDRDRYSMAAFFNPGPDTVADPLASCCAADNPSRYEPVRLIDYMSWYIDRNYWGRGAGKEFGDS
ncbi:isopenicillin N synthase family dioxygenase [uncultured Ilumatobacter sp.]|jgi:isopenicillin N synthase-like dioxygenase|uniref:isopenicillin N synthase family dioxygenase n=1 Tax=uncultured Ilumatobacter sp. TaxID=879968 RepID=UPI00374E7E82|tara:strand:- start:342 stop:1367 length:1026 start_codon:yes stop_codon:yes gene_type:complete